MVEMPRGRRPNTATGSISSSPRRCSHFRDSPTARIVPNSFLSGGSGGKYVQKLFDMGRATTLFCPRVRFVLIPRNATCF